MVRGNAPQKEDSTKDCRDMRMKSKRAWICNQFLVPILPTSRCYPLKRALFRWAGIRVGENVRISSSARFMLQGPISIGQNTFIGDDCLVTGGSAAVDIGANVDIAPRVTIVTGTHVVEPDGPNVAGKGYSLPIAIGEGSWVCTGSIILGGTTIGPRSIVAAGAVVRGNFPEGCLIGGVPAVVIRSRLGRADASCESIQNYHIER
jgi:acetyltransferase-like isoleucine patch superfamily enzyme